MKLSKETQSIFKNFASINANLLLREGNQLSTMSENKTIISEVTVTEQFPQNFGIYDVNEFLGVLSLFNDPELSFDNDVVIIKEGKNQIRYKAAEEATLKTPSKTIQFPEAEINFPLSAGDLEHIIKSAGVLKVSDVSFIGKDGKLTALVVDKKNPLTNKFEIELGSTDKTFQANMKIENFKMVAGAYNVSIAKMKISRFKATSSNLIYYIAVESDSTSAE
jgi:hypothetical protein